MYNVRCMKRTQIYLPKEMIVELKLAAQRLDTSMSDLIRQAIKKNLRKIMPRTQELSGIIGLVDDEGLPSDVSQNMDRHLFGLEVTDSKKSKED